MRGPHARLCTKATQQCVQKQHFMTNKVNTAAGQDDLKLCPLETKSPQIVSRNCVQKKHLRDPAGATRHCVHVRKGPQKCVQKKQPPALLRHGLFLSGRFHWWGVNWPGYFSCSRNSSLCPPCVQAQPARLSCVLRTLVWGSVGRTRGVWH